MKSQRQYGLFEKRDGKWVQIYERTYTLAAARRIFQDALLAFMKTPLTFASDWEESAKVFSR